MKRFTDTMVFRKANAGYELAKVVGILFWMPIIAFSALYFFLK